MVIEQLFFKTMSLLFSIPINKTNDLKMQDTKEWTSVKHIEVIMTLEEVFNIKFSHQDIYHLSSAFILLDKVKELTNDT